MRLRSTEQMEQAVDSIVVSHALASSFHTRDPVKRHVVSPAIASSFHTH